MTAKKVKKWSMTIKFRRIPRRQRRKGEMKQRRYSRLLRDIPACYGISLNSSMQKFKKKQKYGTKGGESIVLTYC